VATPPLSDEGVRSPVTPTDPQLSELVPANAQQICEQTGEIHSGAVIEMVGEVPVIRGVTLIRAGMSANRRRYSPELLRRDGPTVFENAPAFVTNHVPDQKSLRNLVGVFKNVRFEDDRLRGDLHGFAADLPLLQKALEAERSLGSERVGLSIDTAARWAVRKYGGTSVQEVDRLFRTPATSVDLVLNPAAGGRLSEALPPNTPMRDKIAKLTETILSGMDPTAVRYLIDGLTEAEIREANPTLSEAILAKAVEKPADQPTEKPATETIDVSKAVETSVSEAIAKVRDEERCARILETKLAASKDLGTAILSLVREQFEGRTFKDTELDAKLTSLREQIGKERPNRPGVPAGDGVISESWDKHCLALEGFFRGTDLKDKAGNTIPRFVSFKRALSKMAGVDVADPTAVREAMGMMTWSGDLKARASEAISVATFDQAWGDVMHRVVLDAARTAEYNTWRLWTQPVPFEDLSVEKKFARIGGYGNFPTVSENGSYDAVTSPTDQQVSFKPSKYGGVETLSWEAILRDDVQVIARIPKALGLAWARTIHYGVYDSFQTNAGSGSTMSYDGLPLYFAGHANIVDTALSASSLNTARVKMMSQTELSSSKPLGIRPRFLLHACPDLDQTAWELVSQGVKVVSNSDSTIANFFGPDGPGGGILQIPVRYGTATTQRWELVSNPEDLVGGLVGFLGGNDMPEILVSDMETQGSRFSHDQIKYKLRGTFGFGFADHRAFVRGQNT